MTKAPQIESTLGIVSAGELAKAAGLKVQSFRMTQYRSDKNREAGQEKPYDVPLPDGFIERSPVWKVSTAKAWLRARAARKAEIERDARLLQQRLAKEKADKERAAKARAKEKAKNASAKSPAKRRAKVA